MLYKVIGMVSNSSGSGLDISFIEFTESGRKWSFEIIAAKTYSYTLEWKEKLKKANVVSAYEYLLLHTDYGKYVGKMVNQFIDEYQLHHKVQLISFHGHTTFQVPTSSITAQLGDGAAIAAHTEINVVTDFMLMDVALGGNGASIEQVSQRLLFAEYAIILDIGSIARLTINIPAGNGSFDVCVANDVLEYMAKEQEKELNEAGSIAKSGMVYLPLLTRLGSMSHYTLPNSNTTNDQYRIMELVSMINGFEISIADKLRTYSEYISSKCYLAIQHVYEKHNMANKPLLVTGEGALNSFLINLIRDKLEAVPAEIIVPEDTVLHFKKPMTVGLMGVLRWREEYNMFHDLTGAARSSIGGAVWIGQEA